MDALQERLEDAAETPAKPPYRLARLVQVTSAPPFYGPCPLMDPPEWSHHTRSVTTLMQ